MFLLFCSSIRTYVRLFVHMWGYNVFAFPFVSSFVHKVFALKFMTSYFEDPLIDFIHMWHNGRYRSKVFISTIPTPGVTLGSRSRT